MKKRYLVIAALVMSMSVGLVGCGSKEGKTKDTGKVEIETTTKEDTTKEKTTKEETKNEDTTKEETSKEESTSDAGTKEETTYTTFDEKSQVKYNSVVFGLGDKASDVIESLGAQAAPSAEVPSCFSSENVTEYYFPGMTVAACKDVIFSIDISDNGYGTSDAQTVMGVSINTKASEVPSLQGDDYQEMAGYYYSEGTRSLQVSVEGETITKIFILGADLAS